MKKTLFLCIAIAMLALFSAADSQAVTIGFEHVTQGVNSGDSVDVDLFISGLGDYAPDSLSAFDLNVAYDSTILNFTGYQLGSYLGNVMLGEALDISWGETSPGVVNLAELSLLEADSLTCLFCIPPYLDDLQPSSFTLATLSFDTLALGTSFLGISIDPSLGQGLGDAWGDSLIASTESGNINVVPEPATLLLLGSGLAGLGLIRRFRR